MLLTGHPVAAQDRAAQQASAGTFDQTSSAENIRWFRKDVKSLKKQIISANLELTDTEAQQFWPIYDRYTAEMGKIEDKKFELLQEYPSNYSTITDAQADATSKGGCD